MKESGEVGKMVELLRLLTERTRAATGGVGEVIWYDAVTADGELKWQDELNEKNADFFFGCDGIFLNYNWKAEHLERSLDTLRSRDAIGRSADIYVGIDVFGRGCHGGFDSNKSMEIIRSVSPSTDEALSVAVFAAGWTHEKVQEDVQGASLGQESGLVGKWARQILGKAVLKRAYELITWSFQNLSILDFLKSGQNTISDRTPNPTDVREMREKFLSRDCRFWSLLEPFLFLRGPAPVPDAAEGVLFRTDFNSGCSEKESGCGWRLDLATQQVQCPFVGEDIPRCGSGLMLKKREEGAERGSHSTTTPLLVCRFVRNTGFKLAIEVETAEEEDALIDYKLAVLGDGDKMLEIERSERTEKADVFTVPDDLESVEALGIIQGGASILITSVRVMHLRSGDD